MLTSVVRCRGLVVAVCCQVEYMRLLPDHEPDHNVRTTPDTLCVSAERALSHLASACVPSRLSQPPVVCLARPACSPGYCVRAAFASVAGGAAAAHSRRVSRRRCAAAAATGRARAQHARVWLAARRSVGPLFVHPFHLELVSFADWFLPVAECCSLLAGLPDLAALRSSHDRLCCCVQ